MTYYFALIDWLAKLIPQVNYYERLHGLTTEYFFQFCTVYLYNMIQFKTIFITKQRETFTQENKFFPRFCRCRTIRDAIIEEKFCHFPFFWCLWKYKYFLRLKIATAFDQNWPQPMLD